MINFFLITFSNSVLFIQKIKITFLTSYECPQGYASESDCIGTL